jgi:hypothetical protein
MKEVRTLLYNTIADDATFKDLTGATTVDPRLYWHWTPQRVVINASRTGYGVYYRSGTIRDSSGVNHAARDDQVYTIEIYSKDSDNCDDIADRIVELFRDQQFSTTGYNILHTYATVVGNTMLNEARKLYAVSANVYLTKIIAK